MGYEATAESHNGDLVLASSALRSIAGVLGRVPFAGSEIPSVSSLGWLVASAPQRARFSVWVSLDPNLPQAVKLQLRMASLRTQQATAKHVIHEIRFVITVRHESQYQSMLSSHLPSELSLTANTNDPGNLFRVENIFGIQHDNGDRKSNTKVRVYKINLEDS